MRSSILLFEQRRADNPMVTTPSTRHLMDAVARMEDEGFKQIVLCGLQSDDEALMAELTGVIERFMAARDERTTVLRTAASEFEQIDPEDTGSGFVPHGPCGPEPFEGLTESMFTPAQLRFGQFECLDASGAAIGAMIVIPQTYAPLLNTPWIGMDHWCWSSGQEWPDTFQLRATDTPIDTSAFGDWVAYGQETFQSFSRTPPTSGHLYRIQRPSSSAVLGYLNREVVEPWDQAWWALSSELTSSHLVEMLAGDTLVFDTVSAPGDDIAQMWSLIAPTV